eukprot:Skav213698  [mRNA]  locus=scaffold491:706106:713703:- [translate_table: standard]
MHPFSPDAPPQMLETQVFPISDSLMLQDASTTLPHQPEIQDAPNAPEVEDKEDSDSKSSRSSASFSSTSTPNDEMPPGPPPNRCRAPRPSNASFSEFFKRQQTVTDLYLFMQDEDSSTAAWLYAKFMNYFVTAAIIFTVWQANARPVVPLYIEGAIQLGLESVMLLELLAHFFSTRSGERKEFLKNPYNIIDFIAILPIALRIPYGISAPTRDENPIVHYALYCVVPFIRQLKLIRKFQKLQLLLHVLATTMDALKLLLFLVCLIVLFFGCAFYMLEPETMDSLSTSIYLCTVTVTTVGTCDMNPVTPVGKMMAGALCLTSVLFMAMPLSVLGNAMSQTWADRHRIVLITQTRRKLKNLGYAAEHMPKLFSKFDKDGNGELEMEEFCDLVAKLRIGSLAINLGRRFGTSGGAMATYQFLQGLPRETQHAFVAAWLRFACQPCCGMATSLTESMDGGDAHDVELDEDDGFLAKSVELEELLAEQAQLKKCNWSLFWLKSFIEASLSDCEQRRDPPGAAVRGGSLNASSETPMNPYSMYKSYGSAELPDARREASISRLVISTAQLALLMLAPWALFATLTWALMSRQAFLYHWIRVVVIFAFLGLVLMLLVAAATARFRWLRKGGRLGEADPRYLRAYAWWAGLAGLCLLAFISGCVAGTVIAEGYLHKFYQISSMDAYDNVNPARSVGKEMLDAGRVIFTKGSRLDFNRSFAHQNGSTFCVVPIIAAFDQPLPSTFDFWAAGKDCCTSLGENFNCGAADSTSSSSGMARGGLRPLDCYEVSLLFWQ